MKQLQKLLKEFNGQLTPCVVCYLVKENQVLLGKRIKVSNDLGQNLFSGIGGKLEIGETSEDALIREVKEEIDVEITKFKNFGQVKFLFPHKPKWNQVVDVYLVT